MVQEMGNTAFGLRSLRCRNFICLTMLHRSIDLAQLFPSSLDGADRRILRPCPYRIV